MRKLLCAMALIASPVAAQQFSRPTSAPAANSYYLLKAGTGYITSINVTTAGTAGYVMLFDATTPPADGTVSPLWCSPVAATTGLDTNWRASPKRFQVGAMLVFSSTGCFTKTASATAFLAGDVQ